MKKKTLWRVVISLEDEKNIAENTPETGEPLLKPQKNAPLTINFERNKIILICGKNKEERKYNDIAKLNEYSDGAVIFWKNGTYTLLGSGKTEKYNINLYDTLAFLKSKLGFRYKKISELDFANEETEPSKYKTNEPAEARIFFELTEKEIVSLLLYDFFPYFIATFIFTVFSCVQAFVNLNFYLIAFAAVLILFEAAIFEIYKRKDKGFIENHRGTLSLAIYKNKLIEQFASTYNEHKYKEMGKAKIFFGFWVMHITKFYKIVLPRRVVEENTEFFELLNERIR